MVVWNAFNMGRNLLLLWFVVLLAGCASSLEQQIVQPQPPVIVGAPAAVVVPKNNEDSRYAISLAEPGLTDPLGPDHKTRPKDEAPTDLWERVRLGFRLDIPDDWRVKRELSWLTAHPEGIEQRARRAEPYLHFIVEEADKRNMPLEIALLPAIESGFLPHARSPKQAAGLWQFIPSTAREMGLEQNWWYEGRCDVMASTNAALDYLQELADMFEGDWELALAAYNAGPGRVQRAIKANRNKGLATDFWSLPLPGETRKYVPRLLAIASIFKNPSHHGINLRPLPNSPYFSSIKLPEPMDLRQAASLAQVDQKTLNTLNPGLRRGIAGIDKNYPLLLPVKHVARFEKGLAGLTTSENLSLKRYQVRWGDTIASVAEKFGVAVADLLRVNGLRRRHIKPRQWLVIPDNEHAKGGVEVVPPTDQMVGVVKPTLSSPRKIVVTNINRKTNPTDVIAEELVGVGVSPTDEKVYKQAAATSINMGGVVVSPTGEVASPQVIAKRSVIATTAQPIPTPPDYMHRHRVHHVGSGESLTAIARDYGIERSQLAAWNNISPLTRLTRGQVLRLYPDPNTTTTTTITYRVQHGDTLTSIAQHFNVAVADLRRWNRIRGEHLILGRSLNLRVSKAVVTP